MLPKEMDQPRNYEIVNALTIQASNVNEISHLQQFQASCFCVVVKDVKGERDSGARLDVG